MRYANGRIITCTLLLLVACGASARQRALQVGYQSVTTAETAFHAWDDVEQTRLREAAPTLEAGKAALFAHRVKRDRIARAFETAYSAIGLAALWDTGGEYAAALGAVTEAIRIWNEAKGGKP